jgi:hypothetical protein
MIEEHDDRQRRCPRLGGTVSFRYCRRCEPDQQPCLKIKDCWWEAFDIAAYVAANFFGEGCRRLADARPKPKVNQLLELIEAAKRHAESS